jgi:4-carboxymuconolactone decarboxylase
MANEKDIMIQDIKKGRGYVLDFHKVLMEEDPEFLKTYESLIKAAYTSERALSRKMKEFIFIAALTALRADKNHIGVHIKLAIENGASKREVLEVLECIYPPCGTVTFMNAIEAFKEATPKSA